MNELFIVGWSFSYLFLGAVYIRDIPVPEIYFDWSDFHTRKMSVLERCLYWRDFCIREMPVPGRYLY